MESLTLSVKGLYTAMNEASAIPQGALAVANNIVISKDGIAEPRRGFNRLAFVLPLTTDRADKLLQYQNTLMVHYRNTILARYDSTNGILPYTGSFSNPDSLLSRIKYAEANQNLYFTSSRGIQRLDSITGLPTQAGMFKGLDCQAVASTNTSGFMANNTQVAYRVVWGTTDANANLLQGFPSQRAVISNTTGGNQDVSLSITIPAGVTVNNFFQIYRSDQASALFTSASATVQDILYTATTSGTVGNNVVVAYGSGTFGSETIQAKPSTLIVQDLTYTSVAVGGLGNQVSIAYTSGGTAGSEVVTVVGNAISIKIASGVSTATQVQTAINANTSATALVSVAVTGTPSHAQVTAGAVSLAGGQILLNIASGSTTAQTILALVNGSPAALAVVTAAIAGVALHTQTQPASVTLSGGTVILGTPDDSMQLVYEGTATGSTLAVQDLTYTSVLSGTLGNNVKVQYITGGTAGSEVVSVLPSTIVVQDLTYTSVAFGGLGDLVSVAYTSGATAGAEVVTVSGNAISVQIASGVSTANQILASINNSSAALNIVSVAVTGTGTNTQTSASVTSLGGGEVKVTIASGVSTANQVLAAVNNSTAALQLLSVAVTGTGTNTQVTAAKTPLAGGTATITVVDKTPDSLRGAALYTNSTQQGILQSNELPPYASDLAVFRNCLFFGNTRTKQILQFSILAAGGSSGIQLGDTITIAGITYTAASSESIGSLQYQLVTTGSASQNINDTALSLVRVINQNTSNTSVNAFYVSSPTGLPGQIQVEERVLGGSPYTITASAHGTAFSPTLPTSGTKVISTNQVNLNGLMYSKQQEPDAVPSTNILYVGSASKKILRILALRDSLFILKEDGVFRCTGADPTTFSIDLVDNTAILLAPESAVTLSNQIFALTSQGIVAISDTGVEVLSRAIEDQIVALFGSALAPLSYYSFGVGYESEREYILWTVSSSTDTYPTQAFVYNIFTKAWTRWTRTQGSGLVLTADNKLYVTDPTTNYINQERKSLNYTDFADESLSVSITGYSGMTVTLADATSASVGDMLYQSAAVSSIITSVNVAANQVNVADTLTWSIGGTTFINKSFSCLVEWTPNSANGQPGYSKQWSEAVCQFKQNNFNNATLNFYSEISFNIEPVPITGTGTGLWGRFPWGNIPWGGNATRRLARTYVPLNKQRCGILSIQFQMREAYSSFALEGVVMSFRYVSTRTGN